MIVKNNNREIRRRGIRLKLNRGLKPNNNLENLFTDIHIAVNDLWRYKIGKDTIDVLQNETTNYNEVGEVLNMINAKSYLVQCEIDSSFPKRDIKNIRDVEKINNEFHINYDYGYCYTPSIICVILNNKLIINEFIGPRYP